MPQNLFALVRVDEKAEVRRVRLHGKLQQKVTELLIKQEDIFFKGVDKEVAFNGDWKPGENEVLVLDGLDEIGLMTTAITSNATSYQELELAKFKEQPVKALFSGFEKGGSVTVQIQRFMSSQLLVRNQIPVLGLQTGNTFTEITEPMFTFGRKLVAVIQDGQLKFKSFANLRAVCDLTEAYREATDDDLQDFVKHALLSCDDVDSFMNNADSTVRKMVHTITQSDVLDNHGIAKITKVAQDFPHVKVSVSGGRVQLPSDKQELKTLLHFLLDDIFEAPLSGEQYQTNSKRKVGT